MMMKSRSMGGARSARGVSLLEIIVVIVVLGVMGAGFMSMYADVTRRNASASNIAAMTWLGQGVMEAVLAQQPVNTTTKTLCQGFNGTYGPYQLTCKPRFVASKTTPSGTVYDYKITVTVSCVSGACAPVTFKAHAYTT